MNGSLKRLFVMLICFGIICTGCQTVSENAHLNAHDDQLEEGDALVVYVTGMTSTLLTDKEELTIYPSKYTVGTQVVGSEMNARSGNIFAQALEEYSQKTGIKIEIHFLEEQQNENGDPLQFLYDQDLPLPDLLIASKHTGYDYDRLAEQGILLDFTTYTEQEGIFIDTDTYYTRVLEGGRIRGKQYAIPLLFNLNTLITSASYLEQIRLAAPNTDSSYEDILYLLENSCYQMRASKIKEAIWDASMRPAGKYIPNILTAAAYGSYWDERGDLLLEADDLTAVFSLMNQYNQQEFVNLLNWEEQPYHMNVNARNKSAAIASMDHTAYEEIGIFLTGGRCGGLNFHSSLLTDAAYFHSAYQKENEEMILCGIPSLQAVNTYTANITSFVLGFAGTKYPEICYDVSRYLMDYAFPSFYGFSVNQKLTEKQLQEAQSTELVIYPSDVWSRVMTGNLSYHEIEGFQTKIEPLDEKTATDIQNMLSHIVGAGLPCSILEREIYTAALEKLGSGTMTARQVSEWVIKKLMEYRQIQDRLEPFYDEVYIMSFAENLAVNPEIPQLTKKS